MNNPPHIPFAKPVSVKNTPISFVTVIKNRTNIVVEHDGKQIALKLFENNLRSLINLINDSDTWEFNIIDFSSTDVNMKEFIISLPKKQNLKFKIYTITEDFNKGMGLNYGAKVVTHPIVFFLDADMIIKTRELFNDIETYVVKQNKVLFPICWSYSDPSHSTGWSRHTGVGNVIQKKETIIPYVEKSSYGKEDSANAYHYRKAKMSHRTYYEQDFCHQWHPTYIRHIHYKDKA